MKRFAFAILAVAVAAASVLLALNWFGAEARADVTITVNSKSDKDVADSVMTLREAMMLAVGDLSRSLTKGECRQVSDTHWEDFPPPGYCATMHPPGPASADTIVFDTKVFPQDSPATITLANSLPVLDTGDDTLDGSSAGVIIDGGGTDMFACLSIASDSNGIQGLVIRNCREGIWIHGAVHHNTIGGGTAADRNVICGNNGSGVMISEGAYTNFIEGDYIGIDASGSSASPNGFNGVWLTGGAQGNVINANVISGNAGSGVAIGGSLTSGNWIRGNYIGTNASGTAAIPNTHSGVSIALEAFNNTLGGTGAGVRNLISGNGKHGVFITGGGAWPPRHNDIQGNYIGTNAAGDLALPNGENGVCIAGSAHDNTVGGTGPGEGNLIAYNTGDGVRVDGSGTDGNTIRDNSIHSNGDKGIENIDGGNTELTPPTITGFGSVTGTACPDCEVDVYSDDEDEGRVYEGSTTTADGGGNWSFAGSPQGPNITATATDADGNTSEFSASVAVPEPTPTPAPSPTPGPTRTLHWGPGWHNEAWSGASTPEEAFACAEGSYAAAYRLVSGGWERYFPDRPDISNMTDLAQYDAFLILVTGDVTCEMVVADPAGTERTLDWGLGWQNDGWTGADGTTPQDAFACADGSYAAAYRLVSGGWERYFPDRPEISNMGSLDRYDALLILVTAPVSCTMAIAP